MQAAVDSAEFSASQTRNFGANTEKKRAEASERNTIKRRIASALL